MKRTFLTILPIAAALLLATSCSKDSDNDNAVVNTLDNTVPVQEQVVEDNQAKTIPFSITVGKDSESLSKATLQDGTTTTQVFETGDILVLKNGETKVAELALAEDGDRQTAATFSGSLTTDGLTSGETVISVTLKNDSKQNLGTPLTAPQTVSTLAEAFQKYGYWTSSFTYKEGETPKISLTQNTAFLNIDLPFHGAKIDVTIGGGSATPIYVSKKQVVAIPNGAKIKSTTINISEIAIDVLAGSKKVVYNIRSTATKKRELPADCIAGLFSVGKDKQIFFSKGNLRATTSNSGASWSWSFANNQWDFVGNKAANTTINGNGTVSENGTVDLFNWVGAASSWTGAAQYGISNSYEIVDYGNTSGEALKSDWGKVFGEDSKWYTLSKDEWDYLFFKRGSNSYVKATVNNKSGIILLPDDWDTKTYTLKGYNDGSSAFTNNKITSQIWQSTLQPAGAVFLPLAGNRYHNSQNQWVVATAYGYYWSSTSNGVYASDYLSFTSSNVSITNIRRYNGMSVRLVRAL